MTACPDQEPLLQALFDGELDAANALAVEAHLKTCQACAAHYRTLQALRARLSDPALSPPAPLHLRARVEDMIARESGPQRKAPDRVRGWRPRLTAGWATAGAMAAVAATLFVAPLQPATPGLEQQLVASHVRSLLANHLIDVATSDRHVVKPWFNGKIDFAPPVVDLAEQGFPLVGGRLDYADNRVVAALVYRRRAHVINLFVMPAQPQPSAWRLSWPHRTSYSVVHWTADGLDFWAVSDVEGDDLRQFEKAFAARAPT
jgi:anti-sigma factor RsiW